MSTQRLEAFSDGVIAIIITIMVLELKVPHDPTLHALVGLLPVMLSYVLSFIYVGIYWNNHHHLLHLTPKATGGMLWANLHLLFWLSLIPFVTGWMGENHFEKIPTAAYGVVLLMSGLAFVVLQMTILKSVGPDSPLARALGRDWKGKSSMVLYAVAVAIACVLPWLAHAMFVAVAAMWFVPDRRIERELASAEA